MHKGVDVDTPEGFFLVAPTPGNVECLDDPTGYGTYAILTPSDKSVPTFLAGHLSTCLAGEKKLGDRFAATGNTGGSTGAHLHWEEQSQGQPQNPTRGFLEVALKVKPPVAVSLKKSSMVDFIATHEGKVLTPYADSGGIPTIGYGATTYEDGRSVSLGDPPIDDTRAKQLLAHHLKVSEEIVSDTIKVPLTENQRSALVSFAYNTGTIPENVASAINGGDMQTAANIMNRWVHDASGNRLEGLVTRRQEETEKLLSR
jgi:lysozyme